MTLLRPGLCPSLTADIVAKLANNGIKRVLDFICTDAERITAVCEISYKTVLSIRRVLLAQYSSFPINGINLYEESVATLSILPTRCKELDDLLTSGIFTGEVTEIRGPAASGKTQFCINLAVNIVDSLTQNVIFIDTSCGFSTQRTAQILTKRVDNMSRFSETLSHIRVCECTSAHQLLDILTTIRRSLNCQNDSFFASLKAVIVDSVPAVIVPFLKSVSYVEGQSLLMTIKNKLNSLAKDFTIAVVITNDSYSTLSKEENAFPTKNALGHSWSTAACCQIDLPNYLNDFKASCKREDMNGFLQATLSKSTHTMTDGTINMMMNDSGICEISCGNEK